MMMARMERGQISMSKFESASACGKASVKTCRGVEVVSVRE
jgi:hypothetical protein